MPPTITKTPDPPLVIPGGCATDAANAQCYSLGYQAGYGRGYQRAYDDYHSDSKAKRDKINTPHAKKHKKPPSCEDGGARESCYNNGYKDGYNSGYISAEADVGDA